MVIANRILYAFFKPLITNVKLELEKGGLVRELATQAAAGYPHLKKASEKGLATQAATGYAHLKEASAK